MQDSQRRAPQMTAKPTMKKKSEGQHRHILSPYHMPGTWLRWLDLTIGPLLG